jgi:hypothetical protein
VEKLVKRAHALESHLQLERGIVFPNNCYTEKSTAEKHGSEATLFSFTA